MINKNETITASDIINALNGKIDKVTSYVEGTTTIKDGTNIFAYSLPSLNVGEFKIFKINTIEVSSFAQNMVFFPSDGIYFTIFKPNNTITRYVYSVEDTSKIIGAIGTPDDVRIYLLNKPTDPIWSNRSSLYTTILANTLYGFYYRIS